MRPLSLFGNWHSAYFVHCFPTQLLPTNTPFICKNPLLYIIGVNLAAAAQSFFSAGQTLLEWKATVCLFIL